LKEYPVNRNLLPVLVPGVATLLLGGLLVETTQAAEMSAANPVRMPLSQARQTVAMLNDLYVTSVVTTHSTYVKDKSITPAATVARQVFEAMARKGWPQTRWLSTTGRPFNPEHNPKDTFERDAVVALKKGQARYERIENGHLRVVTLVPLVDKSCMMCHTRDQVGDPIGGLSYTVALAK
jgi:hypothetical protein